MFFLRMNRLPALQNINPIPMAAADWYRAIYLAYQLQRPSNIFKLLVTEEVQYVVPGVYVFFCGAEGRLYIENLGIKMPESSIHAQLNGLCRGPLEQYQVIGTGQYYDYSNYIVYVFKKTKLR